MHIKTILAAAVLSMAVGACHGHGHDFENLPECVDDHIDLGEAQSIAHCLYDFPELHPTFADQQECVDWVEDNGGYPDSRDAACADYLSQLEG
jgi:hypothetical protein